MKSLIHDCAPCFLGLGGAATISWAGSVADIPIQRIVQPAPRTPRLVRGCPHCHQINDGSNGGTHGERSGALSKQVLQSVNQSAMARDGAQGMEHSRHVRLPVNWVMPDSQCFARPPEEYLLRRDKTG